MIKMPEVGKIALNLSTKNKNEYEKTIFISIASYRDPDLINTVKSAYDRAFFKNRLFFSIVSQADESEHPDLSFIPEKQIRYIKFDWRESLGACWAREISSRDISQNYFFQIDSHSRFIANWDKVVTENYNKSIKYWKQDIVYTMHPHGFSRDHDTGEEKFYSVGDHPHYLAMQWDEE
ncbi:MAG: GlcNAc-transferase family protein, partial [bacterium]